MGDCTHGRLEVVDVVKTFDGRMVGLVVCFCTLGSSVGCVMSDRVGIILAVLNIVDAI